MPKSLEESKTNLVHTEDLPIDDMLDGKDIHQQPEQFGQVISYIHTSLYEDYLSRIYKSHTPAKITPMGIFNRNCFRYHCHPAFPDRDLV